MIRIILGLALLLGSLPLLIGCGGGAVPKTPNATGRVAVTVAWSAGELTLHHHSVVVTVAGDRHVIPAPTASVEMANVPVGSAAYTASLNSLPDGTGYTLSTIQGTATVTANATTTVALVTNPAAVSTLAITAPVGTGLQRTVGDDFTITVTAGSTQGIVLLDTPAVQFDSSNYDVVYMNPQRHFIANHAGTAIITARYGTATTTTTFTVRSGIGLTITPPVAMGIGDTQTLHATVTAPAAWQSTAVSWSVQEAGGGSITNGVYTAPTTAGTYHLVATSVEDSAVTATTTVTVQSGSGTVNVQ